MHALTGKGLVPHGSAARPVMDQPGREGSLTRDVLALWDYAAHGVLSA